jgi:hypothetical protein
MSKPNAIFFDGGYALIANQEIREWDTGIPIVMTTTHLHEDRYVRIDDGKSQFPQLCVGARHYGNTLIYHSEEQLAHDCRARLYKTRAGFDRAVAAMAE